MNVIFALAIGILFGLGIFQLLRRDLIKAAMGFAILFTSVNLFILSTGAFDGELPAYSDQVDKGQVSDPLVQALILTAIVVSFGAYALLLVSISVASHRFGSLDSDDINELKG